jgi:threonine/homoserine/homoserine lactone efflux protein
VVGVGFLLASFLVILMPGPGALYTIRTALTGGPAAGMVAACACTMAILPHVLAAAAGLAAVLQTNPTAYQGLRWAGIGYIAYIAVAAWRDRGSDLLRASGPAGGAMNVANAASRRVLRDGFVTNLLNPKLTLFFLAFIPQFLPASEATPGRAILRLGAVFMLMTWAVFSAFGLLGATMRPVLERRPHALLAVNRTFAVTYILLATALAAGVI